MSADRPFPVYADGEHLTDLPARCACCRAPCSVIAPPDGRLSAATGAVRRQAPLARATGAASRASGRGGGTTLPGRVLLRLAPDAIARLGAELDRAARRGQRHQRQDDDGGDDRRRSSPPTGATRSTTAPARTCTGESPRRCWSRAAARGCSRSTRPGCRGSRRSSTRRCSCSATSSATSSTATARWSASPTSGRRRSSRADGRTRFALNADDPLIADLGRDREGRRRARASSTSASRTSQALPELQHAYDAKHCRRCGAPTPTSAPSSATSATTPAPTAAPTARAPDVAATEIELRGMAGSRSSIRTPAGRARAGPPPPRPLQRLQRAGGDRRGAGAGRRARRGSPRRSARCAAAFGRVETIEVGGKPVSILLIKNPAGANEVLRTLRLEASGEGIDLWIALNDRIADGRDVSWIWDADFELLAGAVRRVACAGHAAPEMALRLKYAGWPRGPDRGRAGDRGIARPRRRRSAGAPLRPAHLHRAARAAQAARRRAGSRRSSGDERADASMSSGTTSSAAPTRPTWRSGRSLRTRPRGRCSSLAAGPGGSRCTWPGAGTGSSGSTPTPPCSPLSSARAGGLPAAAALGDARGFEARGRVRRSCSRRCSSCSCSTRRRSGSPVSPAPQPNCSPAERRPRHRPCRRVLRGAHSIRWRSPPDIREVDGWVYSSQPAEIVVDPEKIAIRRLRERSPRRGA